MDKEQFKPESKPIRMGIHPMIASMPKHLKDPKNFKKIQKVIIESFAGKHSHGEVIEWAACAECQRRFANRSEVLKKLGFKSPAQYMVWKQIHTKINELKKIRLPKYNSK